MEWRTPRKCNRNLRNTFLLLLAFNCVALLYYYVEIDTISMSYESVSEEEGANTKSYLIGSNGENLSIDLRVDRSRLSYADIVRIAQGTATNFPISFWEANKNQNLFYKNSSCARFPSVYQLKINNLYWQILRTRDATTYYLFGAYYDVRRRCSNCPAIRLIGTIDRQRVKTKPFCQIWYADSTEPLIVESSKFFYYMSAKRTIHLTLHPGLLTCPIPAVFASRVPIFVSLVENVCDQATNNLRVIFNKPNDPAEKKAGFAVCVKMLDFLHDDRSLRLTEWIELVRLLGADNIIIYTLYVHENMTKVLQYYEERGVLERIPTTLVGDEANLPYFQHLQLLDLHWRQRWVNEVVQLNDCFYKNMYKYDYITLLDTDEVIVPHNEYNWTGLMKSVRKETASNPNQSSFEMSMAMFPPCENRTEVVMWYMLKHVLCDRGNSIRSVPKTFFDTEMIEALNNHWPKKCLTGDCKRYAINRREAEYFHYRDEPYNKFKFWSCQELARENKVDTTIWRYKEQLMNRTMVTLYDLGFYG